MSDTEVKRRMSEASGSSSDQENGPGQTQNFREDGEPLNRPRKDSSSSSSDEEGQDDQVQDSSSSSAISKSVSQDQTSSSESARVISKEEKEQDSSSSDTDEDVSKREIDEEEDEVSSPIPVPAARKVSAPTSELTKEEVELSKRETVALKDISDSEEEIEEEKAEVAQVQVNVEEVSDNEESDEAVVEAVKTEDVKPVVEEEPLPVAEQQASEPEIKRPQFRHSASSSSDDEIIPDQQASYIKGPSPSGDRALDERKEQLFAASVSPVPPPASQSPVPSRANASNLTKIYTDSLEQNNNNNNEDKATRAKPSKDITSIYTQAIAKSYTPPSSPKPVPSRNKDITQLYTGQGKENGQQQSGLSPCIAADKLNPKKHNMSTAVDKDAIRRAYEDVRSDGSDTQWAVFKFDGNNLKFSGSGADFKDFKASFSNEDRGFGYIRINTGDEMSKRAKFVFVTWVGPSVSVMKKAKMSTDKALMKDIIQNMSVELQFENHSEFSHDHFKSQVDKAAGARYGTGERAL